MGLTLLAHYNVRTPRLAETRDFYVEVLGLTDGDRPPFDFPGHWLYCGDRDVLHLVGTGADGTDGLDDYLGAKATATLVGGGAIDHVAFTANGVEAMIERLEKHGIESRHRRVPSLGLYQIFVDDPNGITIELNFSAAEAPPEPISAPGPVS